jgi:MoaA/NifB/PqqE/SkfB family radical SAM enzyme
MQFFKYLKRYTKQFFNNSLNKNKIHFLIFFVTYRCSCRCGTCFYWKELERQDELSLDEIKKSSESIGEFHTLLLSGGEPFLRNDILEICELFIEQNKISILSIPTNGTLPERIREVSEKILKKYPRLTLSVAFSLDGFKETHDKIRATQGVFLKAMRALQELSELKKYYKNLEVVINTVITNKNINELESFMDFIYKNCKVDYHDFELLRGEYKDTSFALPSLEDIRYIHTCIIKNRELYLKRDQVIWYERVAVISFLVLVEKLKELCLTRKSMPYLCSAGKNIGVIDANGDVRLCELLDPVGNLRQANYDFSSVWNSRQADELRDSIIKKHCSCTHNCFIKLTASSYLRTIFYLIYYYFLNRIKK